MKFPAGRRPRGARGSVAKAAITSTAAAAFTVLAPAARADSSVTLFGTLDAAVVASRSGAPGAKTDKQVASGVSQGSAWGVRGSEDLGGGLRAFFMLEAGLDLDTGAAKSYAGNPATATPTSSNGTSFTGFNRRSYVGLDTGGYGTLTIGRDYTPAYYAARNSDVFRLGMFGNLQETVPLSGGSERSGRVSNALFYTSPTLAGLRGRAVYSLGSESSGATGGLPRKANTFVGIGLEYTFAGLQLNSSYQRLNPPVVAGTPPAFTGTTSKREDALIGAKYTLGDFAFTGGYWHVGTPNNARDAWLGASMDIGASTLLIEAQRIRQDTSSGQVRRGVSLALGYVYTLSKRTVLYANYGQVDNDGNASFAVVASDAAIAAGGPGTTPKVLALGMRHNF